MNHLHIFRAALAVACLAVPAAAQDHTNHAGHATSEQTDAAPSTRAFMEANDRMHRDMSIAFSGDADIDFIKGMIPHHQGAIDMAQVLLAHGKDPETRKLAETIIAAQTEEIAMMKAWLQARGH